MGRCDGSADLVAELGSTSDHGNDVLIRRHCSCCLVKDDQSCKKGTLRQLADIIPSLHRDMRIAAEVYRDFSGPHRKLLAMTAGIQKLLCELKLLTDVCSWPVWNV